MSDASKAVFLSYASQDAEAAKRIADALRAAGIEVWFDQSELVGGDAWDTKIRKQIGNCALFVPIVSTNTQARAEGYFRLEWKLADRRTDLIGKSKAFLLPVCIDDTKDADADVPDSFLAVQWTRLPGGETTPAFGARVKKLLAGEMETGRPRPAGRSGGTPPPNMDRTPRIGPWLALGAVAVVVLALTISRPWRRSDAPGAKPSSTAPLSQARQLAEKAKDLIKPGATRTELEAADKLCAKAAALDPADAEVLAIWSQVCSWFTFHHFDPDLERKDAAKTRADQAVELDAKSFEARFAQAFYLTPLIGGRPGSADDEETADKIQRQLLQERPDEPRVLLALGIRQGRSFHIEEARATFERLVKNPAYAAAGWGELGWAEMLSSNYAAAEAAVDRANDIQPLWRNLVLKTLLAMEWRGDVDRALAMEKRMPTGVTDLGVLGAYIRLAGRDPQGTLQSIEGMSRNWLRTGGYEGPKAVWTALAYEQLHEKDRAEAEWQFALKLIQDQLTAEPTSGLRRLEAFVLAALNRPGDAEKALRLAPDAADYLRGPWLTRNRYVLTQMRLGHIETVMDYLEKDPRLTAAVLRLEPAFESLRTLPRFQALQTRIESDPSRSPNARTAAPLAADDKSAQADKSVAVLAFADLSEKRDSEYFSDGISEELLNVLAKVPGLKVSARTSAFYFKGKNTPIPEIAKQLGVAYVIEGSVRKAGDKVRITAQLIKAADGFHVWSDTFTRDLKDIFAVQDEIAGLIAKNLELKMGMVAARPTVDLEAYQEYLTGRALFAKASNDDLKAAVGHFEKALAIEPKFTAAWVQLASVHTQLGRWGGTTTLQAWAAARAAIDHAIALEPDSPDVLLALGWIMRTGEWNWRGAERAYRRAMELRPDHADTLSAAAVLLFNLGRKDEALALGRRAVQLDPLNAATQIDLSLVFYFSREWAEQEKLARRAIQLAPTGVSYHGLLAYGLAGQRRFAEAEAEARQDTDDVGRFSTLGLIAALQGQGEAARKNWQQLEELSRVRGDTADLQLGIADIAILLGDKDHAFAALEKAVATRDPSVSWFRNDNYLQLLRADPRWDVLLRKVGLADDQLK